MPLRHRAFRQYRAPGSHGHPCINARLHAPSVRTSGSAADRASQNVTKDGGIQRAVVPMSVHSILLRVEARSGLSREPELPCRDLVVSTGRPLSGLIITPLGSVQVERARRAARPYPAWVD